MDPRVAQGAPAAPWSQGAPTSCCGDLGKRRTQPGGQRPRGRCAWGGGTRILQGPHLYFQEWKPRQRNKNALSPSHATSEWLDLNPDPKGLTLAASSCSSQLCLSLPTGALPQLSWQGCSWWLTDLNCSWGQ